MLKYFKDLIDNLEKKFDSIDYWPEIELTAEDSVQLRKLENITHVSKFSFQMKTDQNHSVLPSQYILYAICVKELAIAVKEHLNVFELIRAGKSNSEVGEIILSGNYDKTTIDIDDYSKDLALKIFTDKELNKDSKSIVNGTFPNYTIRGISDFYTSIILKPINIPAASSSILGKFIYQLSLNHDVYSYLEKRFLEFLPYILKSKNINTFTESVYTFLVQYDNASKFKDFLIKNNDTNNINFNDGEVNLTTIFKASKELLSNESLSQGGRLRFFKEPIDFNVDTKEFYYYCTEWTDNGTGRLDMQNFKKAIEKLYPEFSIEKIDDYYVFGNKKQISTVSQSIEISSKSIREFAFLVFEFFYGKDWKNLIDKCIEKDSIINDVDFVSMDFESFNRLLGKFTSKQTKESLTSSNTIRYFEKEIFVDSSNQYYYFTTQWNAVGEYNLSFKNLRKYFENKYPEYSLLNNDGVFSLVRKGFKQSAPFKKEKFIQNIEYSNLVFENNLITRFTSSLLTKPFVILTGLSGSGKTKLAQAFAMWLCGSEEQYQIVPVGADWTNREPLLGFPNALESESYVKPDSGVLDLIIRATQNESKPYFLILDEMNLSHVERYFADFLSTMESGEEILLHAGDENWGDVPPKIALPKNLFIVGTVNIDETTYMFSPKVLDRASVIEFRVTEAEMESYLKQSGKVDMETIKGQGAAMEQSFVALAMNRDLEYSKQPDMNETLVSFFRELKRAGAEFGYRSAAEIRRFAAVAEALETAWTTDEILDVVIMQKLLPKLHGSRKKLVPVLETLIKLCVKPDAIAEDFYQHKDDEDRDKVLYPIALEKLQRMYRGLLDNGFSSYAEA